LMAKNANLSPDELQDKVVQAYRLMEEDESPGALKAIPSIPVPSVSEIMTAGNCKSQTFEVSLFKIIGVSGTLTLCGNSSSDWSAEVKFCLLVAGASVFCRSFSLDPHNLSVSFDIDTAVANAKISFTLNIHNNKACFNIKGKACIWAPFIGWKCADFDVTPFCIPLPF
jgi:hypothetical protein